MQYGHKMVEPQEVVAQSTKAEAATRSRAGPQTTSRGTAATPTSVKKCVLKVDTSDEGARQHTHALLSEFHAMEGEPQQCVDTKETRPAWWSGVRNSIDHTLDNAHSSMEHLFDPQRNRVDIVELRLYAEARMPEEAL